jgi:two-component sensor histidine kinase
VPSTYRVYSVPERNVITGAADYGFLCDEDAVDGGTAETVCGEPTPSCPMMAACADCSQLQEADHRVANHLFLLAADVRSKALRLNDLAEDPSRSDTRLMLDDLAVRIAAVAHLHRLLTAQGRHAAPDLGQELHELCTAFRLGLVGAVEILEDLQAGCVVAGHQILPLLQTVAEVVTNAVKYAHPDGEAGAILVRCRKHDGGSVRVEVIDDGVGVPDGSDPQVDGGVGFRLVHALGRQLRASVAFESPGRGLAFRLELPGV